MEMPEGMNSSNGKAFPKMQVYTEFDYDKVVELINSYSPAFSKGTVKGVLDTLATVMKNVLPMGHTLKIDNLGVFSLALEFTDSETEDADAETEKTKYHHVKARNVNFRVDQKLVDDINNGQLAHEVTERLMKVAQQARCCIVCVIHQNKAAEDRTLRGSIGTELTNKAFEVYECEKLPSRTFVVTQKLTRKYDIVDALYFTVDDRGLPRQVGAPQTPAQIQSPQDTSLILFRQALAGHGRLSGDELRSKVMSAAGMTSFKLYGLLLDKALSDGLILKTVEKRHVYYSLARP